MLRHARKKGFVSVLALVLLALLATLSVSYAVLTDGAMLQASNLNSIQAAQTQAESGLEYFNYQLTRCSLPAGATGQELLDAVAADLSSRMNGTPNMNGATIEYDGTRIVIPAIIPGREVSGATRSGRRDSSGR